MSAEQDYAPRSMSLADYQERITENPEDINLEDAAGTLGEALMSYGTRTVIEEGEEVERPRWGDREPYVIFGNSDTLYELTQTFLRISENDLDMMPRIEGESGTGKSQLANALVKGVYDHMRGDGGAMYALSLVDPEIHDFDSDEDPDGSDFYRSPINADPLTAIKALEHFEMDVDKSSDELESELNEKRDSPREVKIPEKLDPHLQKIMSKYVFNQELCWEVIANKYARAERMYVDIGTGMSRIKSDADLENNPYVELFGHDEEMNPGDVREWPLNGYLQAGNRIMTIVDDADQGTESLEILQSIADGEDITFDGNKSSYSIDTVPIIIKNPDEWAIEIPDSVQRRFKEFEVNYLTNASIESELIRYMMGEDWTTLEDEDLDPEDSLEMAARPLFSEREIRDEDNGTEVEEVEYAPHAVEAAALADVISRLEDERNKPSGEWSHRERELPEGRDGTKNLGLLEKTLIFSQGYAVRPREYKDEFYNEIVEKEHFEFQGGSEDGQVRSSIPVTLAIDVLSGLKDDPSCHEESSHPVVMPWDVIDEMKKAVKADSTLDSGRSDSEQDEALERIDEVEEFIYDRMAQDVLDAMFHEFIPGDEKIGRYMEMLDAYNNGHSSNQLESREVTEGDLRRYEEEFFGFSGENDDPIEEFRTEISLKSGPRFWDESDEDHESSDINPTELREVRTRIGLHDWEDVTDVMGVEYREFDPELGDFDPMNMEFDSNAISEEGNDTKSLMSEAAVKMTEQMDYSQTSAKITIKRLQQLKQENKS